MKTCKRLFWRKVIDFTGTHTTITTVAFSHYYRLYMIVTANFKMYFLNELFHEVHQIDMSSIRLVNFAYFDDRSGSLITAGIDGVFIFDFNYQGKYLPALATQIDKEGKHITVSLENKRPLEKMCIWVKGLRIDVKNSIIVSWNEHWICFNHMPEKKNTKRDIEDDLDLKCDEAPSKAGKLLFTVKDLTSPEVAITDVLINLDYRYFHTGTSVGHILVWKFDTQGNSKKQIHSFRGHFKEVSCLMPARREPDLLISAALDSTVRIWSLDKF